MAFSILTACTKQTPESEFWKWFKKNEAMVFDFEQDQEATFDKLAEAMSKVHPELTFEFSPKFDGKREFVISAGGIKEAFPAVESLCEAAPKLSKWEIIKFRPRRSPMDISFGETEFKVSDVSVSIEADGDKAGFTVFMKDYEKTENHIFEQAGYLMLDQAIGEYDMETRVGFIEFKNHEATSEFQKHPLSDLTTVFDGFMER